MSELVTVPRPDEQASQAKKRGLGFPRPSRSTGPRKNDIVSRRKRWPARLWRLTRMVAPWAALAYLGYMMWTDPAILSVVLIILGAVGRIVFAIFYMVIQFGAIFWFMSRSK